MDNLTALQDIDLFGWFIIFVSLVLVFQFLYKTFAEGIIQKFGIETKKMRQRREDHELLIKTSQNLALLQEKHESDNEISNQHDNELKELITEFIKETRTQMDKIAYDRINDREKSREIRADLAGSIKIIAEDNEKKGVQIDALMLAQREVLADRINRKYKEYIALKGIPEDEYDEFVNMHTAYKSCGGNSSGDAKFDYCINHLPVLPVETKLIIKHNN